MQTEKYARKPFYVDAIQVTLENVFEVAEWCQGDVVDLLDGNDEKADAYIKVRVHRPLNERQTKAYVGDWVLYAGTGYKVYTKKAFEASFETVKVYTEEDAQRHLDGAKDVQAEVVQPA